MSEIKHRDRILEAIDQLRKRKARPDVNRICSFMFRRFAVNCIETKLDLQKLIEEETVIKVDYKGNTSYRNAAKWAMLPSYRYKKEADTSSLLSSAVAELIVLEPDYLDIGVPGYELEAHMIQKDSKRFSKKNLESILKREVGIGTLVKLDNGNYFLGEHSSNNSPPTMERASLSNVGSLVKSHKANIGLRQTSPRQKKSKIIPRENSNELNMKADDQGNSNESTNVGFRVGVRQKRARIVFDPSDNNLPTRISKKRGPGRPLGSGVSKTQAPTTAKSPVLPSNASNKPTLTPTSQSNGSKSFDLGNNIPPNPGVCSICHSYGIRIKGVPERLISCSDCTTRAHPSCLENGKEGTMKNKNGIWKCVHCKTCQVCEETAEVGSLAICNSCSEAYHYQCHSPIVPEKARAGQNKWFCCKCQHNVVQPEETNAEDSSTTKELEETEIKKEEEKPVIRTLEQNVTQPVAEEVPIQCLQDPYEGYPLDESIPDASDWTTAQVYEYFSNHFQPELAKIFKDQDIDGQSLLLMKRNDVLRGFSLKLGPALKLYGHVKRLQIRRSHPKLLWS